MNWSAAESRMLESSNCRKADSKTFESMGRAKIKDIEMVDSENKIEWE